MDHQRSSQIMITVLFSALIMEPHHTFCSPSIPKTTNLIPIFNKFKLASPNPFISRIFQALPKKANNLPFDFLIIFVRHFFPSTSRFFQSSWMAVLQSWWIPLLLPVMAPVWSASGEDGGMGSGYNWKRIMLVVWTEKELNDMKYIETIRNYMQLRYLFNDFVVIWLDIVSSYMCLA